MGTGVVVDRGSTKMGIRVVRPRQIDSGSARI
ncbi:unnamed protein product, partial [Brachionus calyciflorus]